MVENSAIEWCHHTFNPWRGCTKVSPGCANCYAEKLSHRNPKVLGEWGAGAPRVPAADAYWKKPIAWNKRAAMTGKRERVFCASLSDWLDDDGVPAEWLARLLGVIDNTPSLDWLLLTKRPQNFKERLDAVCDWDAGVTGEIPYGTTMADYWLKGIAPDNVWVGTSVENQKRADERIPRLLDIPAKVRFLSCEPLLGPVDLSAHLDCSIDWVIVGGESGPKARPMCPSWAASLRDQCQEAAVHFFFKQWGAWVDINEMPDETYRRIDAAENLTGVIGSRRVGKKAAGRYLDGRTWDQIPKG